MGAPLLRWSLLAGIVLGGAVLAHLHWRLAELAAAQQVRAERFASALESLMSRVAAQEASTSALRDEVALLRTQLAELASREGTQGRTAPLAGLLHPGVLAPGVYVLGPDGESGADVDAYTIYHISATVQAGDFARDLQFGAARSGLVSWQLYFDYDNDGRVDSDMLREFVDSVPFGGYVAGSLDEDRSQRIYERLLSAHEQADYTAPDEIDERGGEIAGQMWSFVSSTSGQLAGWVRSRLENETARTPDTELSE